MFFFHTYSSPTLPHNLIETPKETPNKPNSKTKRLSGISV
ncbi:hypothetical protein LEP1GSC112_0445 [Leptospira interrogans serovar Pomona str. UT364]|nr:hypothetical protein LEP1GSC085_0075 [Leptospira interrogans str. L0996]EMN93332.1 hypothetical protein LEP1GSC110_3570 [Leptospira interrogans serovar Medanensis str. UT053]EMO00874.1 hypothetical protein LEP1GSC112_0445 [Leptospira interrogans serovar Pomona str. UT364]